MSDDAPIGLIGLGAIGLPVARALRDGGFPLVVHDARAGAADGLGARELETPAAVAAEAESVLVSLPTPDVVRDVACGENGLLEGGRLRTYVDLSTTGVAVAQEVAAAFADRGVDVVDAPVSGGVAGAQARSLAVMASGSREAFERVRPLLETFGRNVFHVGDEPGQGQAAKVLNNLLSATAMAITSEALVLGAACGLAPQTLLDVFNAGSGRNTATADKFPTHVLTGRFASGFRLALMAKDVELALDEARARRVPMPVGALVQQLWTLGARELGDSVDHTEYVRLVEGWAGT